jgi:sulfate/thiosulfate transport system substrate-binding protein
MFERPRTDPSPRSIRSWRALLAACGLLLLANGCLPDSSGAKGEVNLTVYGFSVMKEPLERSILPSFAARWKEEHGVDVRFTSSFAGSETITNQILQGVGAQVAILSIERDAQRLKDGQAVTSDWRELPQQGIVNRTPFVILVRAGNPKNIRDFPDLGREGVKLIHPDPTSSGGAQWSLLALYGSELVKSEKETGRADGARATAMLKSIWKNVISTPGSAREAMTQFQTGFGDALVTYELDALLAQEAKAPIEIVVPRATIFSEHVALIVDRSVDARTRPIADALLHYLWSDEAQAAFTQSHLRAASRGTSNAPGDGFVRIELPFTVEYLGGWSKAYPEIIENIWRDQVRKSQ